MKVLICKQPGQFDYGEMDKPAPGKDETLLKIRRIGICGTDLHAYEGTQPYFSYPRILGHEIAADIVETGNAHGFQAGETVTILPYFNCGQCGACRTGKPNCCARLAVCGVHIDGGMSEYFAVPSSSLVHGAGLGYDELALVEPLAIGAHAVQRAGIVPGEYVLVVGAGPIGLGIMEFARIAGAKVIAMENNESRLRFCRETGKVDFTIDAREPHIWQEIEAITHGDMPSVVIDATGNLQAINASFQFMAHGGRYVLVGLQKGNIIVDHPEFHKREASLLSSRNATRNDFEHVINCIKQGLVNPENYITHRVRYEDVIKDFDSFLDPRSGVIKALVSM